MNSCPHSLVDRRADQCSQCLGIVVERVVVRVAPIDDSLDDDDDDVTESPDKPIREAIAIAARRCHRRSKYSAEAIADQIRRCVELRAAGATIDAIAQAVRLSTPTVKARLRAVAS